MMLNIGLQEEEEEEEGAPRREVILTGRLGVCLVGGKMYL